MAGYWWTCCHKKEPPKWNAVVMRRPSARFGRCPSWIHLEIILPFGT
jgi:hypothetical protein